MLKLIRETGAQDFNRVDMEGVMKMLDKSVEGDTAKELPKFEEASRNTIEEAAANHKATQEAVQQKKKIMLEDEVKRISNNYSENRIE